MVSGVVGGMQTLLWSIFLVCIPLYFVAFVMRESAGNLPDSDGTELFSSLGDSFFTMFRCMVGGDCSAKSGMPIFVLLTHSHGPGFAMLYMCTVFFMTFGLFNVIVSIYVDNTLA